jgi:hypothetical protein
VAAASATASRQQRQAQAPSKFVPEPEISRRGSHNSLADLAAAHEAAAPAGGLKAGRSSLGGTKEAQGVGKASGGKVTKEMGMQAKAEAKAASAAEKAARAADKAAKAAEEAKIMAAKAATAAKEAKAGAAGGGRKASVAKAAAPSSKPKPEAAPHHSYVFGDEVEVFGHEEGFEGSWYAAEVMVAKEQHQLLVQYESLFDEASAQPLKEWCHPELLRPAPPRPPADWASHLVAGQALDLSHDDGWWEVRGTPPTPTPNPNPNPNP